MLPKEFAEKFIKAEDEAWLKGNVNALDEVEDVNVVYHFPSFPDVTGRDAHKQFIAAACKALSDIKIDIKYLIGEGDLVGFLYKDSKRSTGEFFGQPPTGKTMSANELWLFRLKNDKVIEGWMWGTTTILD
jgi:predicted ester cyclase